MRAAWILLAGCTGGLGRVEVNESTLVGTTVELSWFTSEPGESWVEFGIDELTRRVEPPGSRTEHAVRLAGLKPDQAYQWQAFTRVGGRTLRSGVHDLHTGSLPEALPVPTLTLADEGSEVADGYVLTSVVELPERTGGGWVVLIDGDGDVVWWFDTGHAGAVPADLVGRVPASWSGRSLPLSSHLDPGTGMLTFAAYDLDQKLLVGTARHVPLTAMSADEVQLTRLSDGHHDFAMVDEGDTVAYLAYHVESVEGQSWAADAVLEIPTGTPDRSNIDAIWSWHTDGPAAPEVTDPLQRTFSYTLAELEWTHSNSLIATDDAYFVMSKFLDCIVKIDRQSGRTEWILGGPHSDFRLEGGDSVWNGLEDSMLWSHAHMSDLTFDPQTRTGRFAVFDNGHYRPGGAEWSRLVEYSFDEAARTVREEWSLVPEGGLFTTLLGDLDRLSEDRWLASWSLLRSRGLEEVDREGVTRWRAQLPADQMLFGRAQFIDTLDAR